MLHVHRKQRDLTRQFYKHVEHILDPEGRTINNDFKENDDERYRNFKNLPLPEETAERAKIIKRQQLVWFRIQYQELFSEVTDRIEELEGFRSAAKSTADSVSHSLMFTSYALHGSGTDPFYPGKRSVVF